MQPSQYQTLFKMASNEPLEDQTLCAAGTKPFEDQTPLDEDVLDGYEVDDTFVRFATSFNNRSTGETTVIAITVLLVMIVMIVTVYFYMQKQAKNERVKMREFKKGMSNISGMRMMFEQQLREAERRHKDAMRAKHDWCMNEIAVTIQQFETNLSSIEEMLYQTQEELSCTKGELCCSETERKDQEGVLQQLVNEKTRMQMKLSELQNEVNVYYEQNETLHAQVKELQDTLADRLAQSRRQVSLSTPCNGVTQPLSLQIPEQTSKMTRISNFLGFSHKNSMNGKNVPAAQKEAMPSPPSNEIESQDRERQLVDDDYHLRSFEDISEGFHY